MPRLTVVLLLLATVAVSAQEARLPLAAEALVGAGVHTPVGSFGSVPGIPSPGPLSFTPESGSTGWWFRVGADLPVLEPVRAGLRLGAGSGTLRYTAVERVPIATEDGGTYLASLTHELSGSATMLSVEPYLRYEPLPWLAVSLGLPVSFALSQSYRQTLRFTDPAGLPFVDGSIEQVTGQGDIPNTAPVFGLSIGAEGQLPLTSAKDIILVPHVGYRRQLTALNTNGAFTAQTFTVGVGVRYLFNATTNEPTAQPEPPQVSATTVDRERIVVVERDTVVDLSATVVEPRTTLVATVTDSVEDIVDGRPVLRVTTREQYRRILPRPPSILRGSLRLAFVHEDGSVTEDARLQARRVRLTRTVPIMPLVVFDDTVSTLPTRYVRLSTSAASGWKESMALIESGVHWQYNVLNIIGFRMRVNPATNITLLTYDDGTDEGRGRAERRLESVRSYLVQTFGIAARRIDVQIGRGQASQPPWVMFVDAQRTLLRPLTGTTVRNESSLPKVRVMPEAVSEAGIATWSVSMYQSGRPIRTFADTGAVPAALTWNMDENLGTDEVLAQQILVELRLQDKEGSSTKSEPGRIMMRSQSVTDVTGVPQPRTEVLRVLPPDFLATPDRELFTGAPAFTLVEFYPASTADEAEYLQSDAPVVKKRVDADVWFRRGLERPERELYQRAELYINDERRP